MKRKIAVILAADVVGYTRLMADDEEETLRRLNSYRQVFNDFIEQYGGRIFNTAGDAVNLSARLQSIAVLGGIWISRSVHEQIANKTSLKFEDLGGQSMKNLPEPVHVFALYPTDSAPAPAKSEKAPQPLPGRSAAIAVAVLTLAVGGIAGWWFWAPAPSVPAPPPATTPSATFVVESVPFLRDDNRADLKDNYLPAREHKALALNRYGYGYSFAEADAIEAAIADCRRHAVDCRIYAVGDFLVE